MAFTVTVTDSSELREPPIYAGGFTCLADVSRWFANRNTSISDEWLRYAAHWMVTIEDASASRALVLGWYDGRPENIHVADVYASTGQTAAMHGGWAPVPVTYEELLSSAPSAFWPMAHGGDVRIGFISVMNRLAQALGRPLFEPIPDWPELLRAYKRKTETERRLP